MGCVHVLTSKLQPGPTGKLQGPQLQAGILGRQWHASNARGGFANVVCMRGVCVKLN